jgi:hypothetical protein
MNLSGTILTTIANITRMSKRPSNRKSNKTHFLVESNINYNKIASTREHKHKCIKCQNGRMNFHPMSPCAFFLFQRGFFSAGYPPPILSHSDNNNLLREDRT